MPILCLRVLLFFFFLTSEVYDSKGLDLRGGESLLLGVDRGLGLCLAVTMLSRLHQAGPSRQSCVKELSGRRASSQGPTAGGRKPPLPASLSSF